MEDNSLPVHTTVASTNSLPLTSNPMDDTNMDIPLAFDQRLAFLQEVSLIQEIFKCVKMTLISILCRQSHVFKTLKTDQFCLKL